MTMSESGRVRFCLKWELVWFSLTATGRDREAARLGPVVDALFADNPREAILRSREGNVGIEEEIRATFDIA